MVRSIAVLGYETTRNVAITLTVATSVVSAVARAGGRLDYRELWRHSVTTGAMAKELAKLAGSPDPEEIFAAGLLHDLGKFILELYSPEAYDQVVHQRQRSRRQLASIVGGSSRRSSVRRNVPQCMPTELRARKSICAATASSVLTCMVFINQRGSYAPTGIMAK